MEEEAGEGVVKPPAKKYADKVPPMYSKDST